MVISDSRCVEGPGRDERGVIDVGGGRAGCSAPEPRNGVHAIPCPDIPGETFPKRFNSNADNARLFSLQPGVKDVGGLAVPLNEGAGQRLVLRWCAQASSEMFSETMYSARIPAE